MEQILIVSSLLLWIVVLLNLLLTLALVRRLNGGSARQSPLKTGQRAPDFSAETLRGEKVDLASYTGRNVAFLFVSPNCEPCREALPIYEALGPHALRSGVELVLVSIADAAKTQAFVEEFKITLPILVAPEATNPFLKTYTDTGTPSYCLVDARGRVQSAGYPSPEWGKWKALADGWEADRRRQANLATSEGR